LKNWKKEMRLKATYLAVGLMATLALAACGGGGDDAPPVALLPPPASTTPPPAQTSNPPPDNTPAPAVSTQTQTQAYTTYQYLDTTVTGKPATLTFQPNQATGALAIGANDYAILTTDAANDGVMTVGGTPTYGTTIGALSNGAQIIVPSFIETCEAVSGDGTPNPAVANAATKSTNVFTAGLFVVDGTQLAGRKFTAYYEDCLRDGSTAAQATHSSLTIDGSGNETIFDSRTGNSATIPVTSTLKQASAAGLHGDWVVPYLYATSTGQLRYALIEHGLVSAGNTRNFIGVWLEE
jgi:hypothetical protein